MAIFSRLRMPRWTRTFFRRLLLWGVVPILTLSALLAAGLYLLCTFNPAFVTAHVEDYLRDATDLPWRVKGEVQPVFSPFFGIRVSNVHIVAATQEQESLAKPDIPMLQVDHVRVYFNMREMLRLSLRLHGIELDSPVISLAYDAQGLPLWLPPPSDLEPAPVSQWQGGWREAVSAAFALEPAKIFSAPRSEQAPHAVKPQKSAPASPVAGLGSFFGAQQALAAAPAPVKAEPVKKTTPVQKAAPAKKSAASQKSTPAKKQAAAPQKNAPAKAVPASRAPVAGGTLAATVAHNASVNGSTAQNGSLPATNGTLSQTNSTLLQTNSTGQALSAPVPEQTAEEFFLALAGVFQSKNLRKAPPLTIHNGTMTTYTTAGDVLLSFSETELDFQPEQLPFRNNLTLATTFSLPGANLEVCVAGAARLGKAPHIVTGKIAGSVTMTPPGSAPVSGEFSSTVLWQDSGKDILLPDFALVAETDALTASLRVDLIKLVMTGDVHLHKLSLPRWFQFGRNLPPGLQEALHALRGQFSLYFDLDHVEARNLRGVAGEMAINGSVSVPDFGKPVVVVDVATQKANLDVVFPFLSVSGKELRDPVSPVFAHSVLAPYPEAPPDTTKPARAPAKDDAPPLEVGYDITVRVAQPFVHEVTGGALEVRVFPVVINKEGMPRIAFTGQKLLQGSAKGRIDIADATVQMHYEVQGMELGQLPENVGSSVRISGKVTGQCTIDIPVRKDTSWTDDWKITARATADNFQITGDRKGLSPWHLLAKTTTASLDGSIHTVTSNGITLGGKWNVALNDIAPSWNPRGKDAITGQVDATLYWPPFDAKASARQKKQQRRTVERLSGSLTASGGLITPLGSRLVPVRGKIKSDVTWLFPENNVTFTSMRFEGFDSFLQGSLAIDAAQEDVSITAESTYTLSPRTLLKAWDLLPPPQVQMPQVFSGKSSIDATPDALAFTKIKAALDGAPITGEVHWSGDATARLKKKGARVDENRWTFRLASPRMDLDTFFPSAAPTARQGQPPAASVAPVVPAVPTVEAAPWDLSAFKDLSLDVQLFFENAKSCGLNFSRSKVTGTLQRDRFLLHSNTERLYGGTAILIVQGTLVPDKNQIIISKGLSEMRNVDLAPAFFDLTQETSYGGKADLIIDIAGTLQGNADVPGKLSGIWNLVIKDGLYPAFISNKNGSLRNLFSRASASGVLDKGVIRWENFRLGGAMVDMYGDGWVDLNTKTLDIFVSVTLAKVPTVPVRFQGSLDKVNMTVRGVHIVLHTARAAGNTVFDLLFGVFELPVKAIGSVFSSD